MFTIRLNNSILGWMLVPVSEGSDALLTELYAEDWNKMKPSDRAFMKGETIDKVIAHIKEICQQMNIGVSFCGKKNGPIPFSIHSMSPGLDWDFSLKGRSFKKLMDRIDNEENNLLEYDKQEWEYIAACFKK